MPRRVIEINGVIIDISIAVPIGRIAGVRYDRIRLDELVKI
jgi:hypothetical protein